jgi:uncharacterized repeat protein (TIGR03803 family)
VGLGLSAARAQTYTVLYTFTGADGANPEDGVTEDASGNLYGTTFYGGSSPCSTFAGASGCGVVFKLTPTGEETVLHSFTGGTDGGNPGGVDGSLIRDRFGNLYGATSLGGSFASPCVPGFGCGVLFRFSPAGEETVLHTFTGGTDGANPSSGLVREASGNFYGTTGFAAFRMTPAGSLKTLYNFCSKTNCADGGGALGDLLLEGMGNLYGTNTAGGAYGVGVLFKLTPAGRQIVLYDFTAGDGVPNGSLIQDAAGSLYGTTQSGGAFGYGEVFKIDPSGQETVLYAFTGGADGGQPFAGLVRDSAGNLYGTTGGGGNTSSSCPNGSFGCGVVFELSPSGTETVLHTFTGGADGASPFYAVLLRDSSGNLYGTTFLGGSYAGPCAAFGCGVVFKLTPR